MKRVTKLAVGRWMRLLSDETTYKSVFIQARGVLKKELVDHLRIARPTEPESANKFDHIWRS